MRGGPFLFLLCLTTASLLVGIIFLMGGGWPYLPDWVTEVRMENTQ